MSNKPKECQTHGPPLRYVRRSASTGIVRTPLVFCAGAEFVVGAKFVVDGGLTAH